MAGPGLPLPQGAATHPVAWLDGVGLPLAPALMPAPAKGARPSKSSVFKPRLCTGGGRTTPLAYTGERSPAGVASRSGAPAHGGPRPWSVWPAPGRDLPCLVPVGMTDRAVRRHARCCSLPPRCLLPAALPARPAGQVLIAGGGGLSPGLPVASRVAPSPSVVIIAADGNARPCVFWFLSWPVPAEFP